MALGVRVRKSCVRVTYSRACLTRQVSMRVKERGIESGVRIRESHGVRCACTEELCACNVFTRISDATSLYARQRESHCVRCACKRESLSQVCACNVFMRASHAMSLSLMRIENRRVRCACTE